MNYIYSIKRMPFISIIESIPEAQNWHIAYCVFEVVMDVLKY
jgi:hypothetical protein